jgi:hypothetical protein
MNGSTSRSNSVHAYAEFVCMVSAIEEDGAIRCIYEFPAPVPVGGPSPTAGKASSRRGARRKNGHAPRGAGTAPRSQEVRSPPPDRSC